MKVTEQFDMEEVKKIDAGFVRKTKKPADDHAPKRPISAYFLFAGEARTKILKDQPSITIAELGKALGVQWNEMSEEDKAPFIALQQKSQKAYSKEMEKYKKTAKYKKHQTAMHAWKIHLTRTPFRKDENTPKRPMTAYILYANSIRDKVVEDNPDFVVTEIMRECGRLWSSLSDEAHKVWSEKAKVLRVAYDKKLAKYKKTKQYAEYTNELMEYKAKNKEKRRRLLGEPKKRKKKKRARQDSGDDSGSRKRRKKNTKSKRASKSPKRKKGKADKKKKSDKKKKADKKKSKPSPSPKRTRKSKRKSRSSPSSSRDRSMKSKRSKKDPKSRKATDKKKKRK